MKPWLKRTALGAGLIAGFYALVYIDVSLRAREAWTQGEQFWRWADYPQERQAYLDQELAQEKKRLNEKLAKGKMLKEDHDRDLELLEFSYAQQAKESCLKYAYVWYQTAVELFSPPESKWVKLSRVKMPLAKERWKSELRAKGIAFEDYMID